MDISLEINSIRSYAETLRNQPAQTASTLSLAEMEIVERSVDLNNISIPEIDKMWNTIKSGASVLERMTRCCDCDLGQRVVTSLNKLESLKDKFCDLLVSLNAQLSDNPNLESSVQLEEIQGNIRERIETIKNTPFPEKFTEIAETCKDICAAIKSLNVITQPEIQEEVDELMSLAQKTADNMHTVDVYGAVFA
ncbi:MAG: hypothetical protein K2L13_02945 [Opitutales bacterium]|nr:hypothetical protein [Opitutales bacterium]